MTNVEKVQAEVSAQMAPEKAEIDTFVTFGGRHEVEGMVLVKRDDPDMPWVVWRWITQFASGEQVPGPTGARLWSGGYWEQRSDAMVDLMERRR